MVATLRIKGDVQSGMFAELNVDLAKAIDNTDQLAQSSQHLGEALPSDEAGELRKAVEELTASMREFNVDSAKSVTVINEQRTSWQTLVNTAVPAVATITTAVVTYATRLAELDAAQRLLSRGTQILVTSNRTWTTTVDLAEKAAIRGAASLAGYGAAAATASTILAGAAIGLKGYELILARTGVTIDEVTGKTVTNYDRMAKAVGDFTEDAGAWYQEYLGLVAENAKATGRYIAENSIIVRGLSSAWEEVDRAMTATTVQGVSNMRDLGSAIRGVSREAVEASERIAEAQARSVDDFNRVREAESAVGDQAAARARAAEVASMQTTAAIESEINRLKERRGIAAANDQFDESARDRYVTEIERLENRRTQIEEANRRNREQANKAEQDRLRKNTEETFARYEQQAAEANDRRLKMADDAIAAAEKQAAEERRIAAETAKLQYDIDQNIQRSNEAAAKAYEDRWKAVTGRIAALIRGQDPNAPGQDIIEQIKGNISQKDLAEQVGKRRAAAAGEEFAGSDKAQKIRDLLKSQGMEDPDIARKMTAMRRQIEQRAGQQGARDVMGGKASDAELLDAQNNLIAQNVNAATETGKLSKVAAEGLRQAAAQSIQASNEAAQARQIAEQVLQALGQSNPRGRAAKNGGR